MAFTLVTVSKDISRRNKELTVSATLAAGNYVPGGITVDLTTVSNPKFLSNGKISANPKRGVVLNSPAGFAGELVPGATLQTWKLKISSAGVELGAVALAAGLVADPFLLEFKGPLGNF